MSQVLVDFDNQLTEVTTWIVETSGKTVSIRCKLTPVLLPNLISLIHTVPGLLHPLH